MNCVYIDIHIHTSEDPDRLNEHYNLDLLLQKVDEQAQGAEYLISFTDHNTINKNVYLSAIAKTTGNPKLHLLLGTELHIKNYDDAPAYHCHIFFNSEINDALIDDVNSKLDALYPHKRVEKMDKSIPRLSDIIRIFDNYDFILLPHGGQSHATFDTSIPNGVIFDSTIERNIYYNQFDGFTARSNKGLEQTIEYFKRLGIAEFVNLVTCTDNYDPAKYPQAKADEASPFIPTWMFAEPTFDGLRLSLSERTRLVYSEQKPEIHSEYIKSAFLNRDNIDIDVRFTEGLNVIIGGSSSGKTLLVDSLYRQLTDRNFESSHYNKYEVDKIQINNPSNCRPHFLEQNYIMKVVDSETPEKIEDIDIIKKVFPPADELRGQVEQQLSQLKTDLSVLISCVERIESITNDIRTIPQIARLTLNGQIKRNILQPLIPAPESRQRITYQEQDYENHTRILNDIVDFLKRNPFTHYDIEQIGVLQKELRRLHAISNAEENVYNTIKNSKECLDAELRQLNGREQTKNQEFQRLITNIKEYVKLSRQFKFMINKIANYHFKVETRAVESMGHKLSILNNFKLDKETVRNTFNNYLKTEYQISDLNQIEPENLFFDNYKKRPKVDSYEDLVNKVYSKFQESNKTIYKIVTKDGKDFESLSAGWRTSVILDLVLGYDRDVAPIIIDQPEDNLATKYINDGLVTAIKAMKSHKQVILVSHNATIPMMADAQNIVLCKNEGNKIVIRSASLEGKFGDKTTLDVIAEITDGGKASIKKRVKKYNLKKFR